MTDPTTTHAWMPHVALRIPSSSGSPLAPPKASRVSAANGASAKREILGLLGHARHQSYGAMGSVI